MRPAVRKGLVFVALWGLATVSGPFGTYDALGLGARLAYWGLALLGCGLFMNLVIVAMMMRARGPVLADLARITAASALAALPCVSIVIGLETVFRGTPLDLSFAARLWAQIAVIGTGIGATEYALGAFRPAPGLAGPVRSDRGIDGAPDGVGGEASDPQITSTPGPDRAPDPVSQTGAETAGAAFLKRLEPDLGRALVSVSANDHYLDVVTEAGRTDLLMRMSDAVAELGTYPGLRIHRSHWVALSAVEEVQRDGTRVRVRLSNGATLPVSRGNVAGLRAALEARTAPSRANA